MKPRTLDVLRTLGGMAVVLLAGLAFLEWSRHGRRVFVVPRIEAYDGRLEVVARMPDGQTPPSCTAVLYGPASMVPRPPIPMDATGRMSFDGLPRPATYAVQVTSAGQGPHEGYDERRLVRVGSTGDAKAEVVFPVTRVAGTVIDATTGKPAPGAQVKAVRLIASKADDEVDLEHYFSSQGIESDETAPPLATTVADAEGGFRIEAVAPAFEIVGTGQDGSTGMELGLVRRGSAEHVTVFLMPTRPPLLEAGVIDENGHPIAGALLSPARGRKAVGDETARSDESGRFRLALGNAWQVRIEVAGSGAALASPPGRVAAATTFRFPRRTGLQVHVVDEATGVPLAGVEVHLFTPGTGGWPSAEIPCDGTAVTDADGLARLPAAPGITPRIMITAPGRRGGFLGADTTGTGPFALGKGSLSTPLSAGELRSIEIRMRHSTRVRGRVVSEEGRPLAGARVRVSAQGIGAGLPAPRTGADGRFEVLDVFPPSERPVFGAAQPTIVVAVLDGYVDTWAVVARAGSAPEDDVGDLVLVRARAFAVRVVGPEGRAVKGVRVRLRQDDVTTEDDGTAIVTCDGPWTRPGLVPPEGNDDLSVVVPGYAPLTRGVPTASRPGAVVDLGELRLVASLGDPVIVVDASGHPVPGVHVLVAMNFRKGALRDAPTTDADGRVRVQAENGWDSAHLLAADGVEYDAFLAQGRHPSFPVRVILPAVRPFRGRVLDESGAPVAAAGVRIQPAYRSSDRGEDGTVARADEWYATSTDDGSFRFRAVAVGASELEVRARGFVTTEVEVPERATEPFEVRMERFGEKHRRRVAEIETRLAALRSEKAEPDSPEQGDLARELRRLRGE